MNFFEFIILVGFSKIKPGQDSKVSPVPHRKGNAVVTFATRWNTSVAELILVKSR